MIPTEHDEQVSLFKWAKILEKSCPVLSLLHAIPNGGKRKIGVAVKLKKEGVKPGIPDIFFPVARGGYHGLYIEMKRRKGGSVSAYQKKMHSYLRGQGYMVAVCHGWESAVDTIKEYLTERT